MGRPLSLERTLPNRTMKIWSLYHGEMVRKSGLTRWSQPVDATPSDIRSGHRSRCQSRSVSGVLPCAGGPGHATGDGASDSSVEDRLHHLNYLEERSTLRGPTSETTNRVENPAMLGALIQKSIRPGSRVFGGFGSFFECASVCMFC